MAKCFKSEHFVSDIVVY